MWLTRATQIAYLFPYVMTHANAPMFWTMNLFLGILVAGFVYEWCVSDVCWWGCAVASLPMFRLALLLYIVHAQGRWCAGMA
jgi:hypothetical protein